MCKICTFLSTSVATVPHRRPALRRPGGRLSFGVHHAHARVPEAPPVSGSFCRQAEEAGLGERARETITVGGLEPSGVRDRSAATRNSAVAADRAFGRRHATAADPQVRRDLGGRRGRRGARHGRRPIAWRTAARGGRLRARRRHRRLARRGGCGGGRRPARDRAQPRRPARTACAHRQPARAAGSKEAAARGAGGGAARDRPAARPCRAGAGPASGMAGRYVDSRHCLTTDATHGRANPLLPVTIERTRAALTPLLEDGLVPVLGGYIAATADGITTTLGRGGSDYSAALVGAALDAHEIQIWTDVSGVLTADPRVVPGARTVSSLSYAEAAELAYFGAKVLHPKTIQPAMERDIPVRICNSRAPRDAGTVVTALGEVSPGGVKAIAHKCGVTILQITSTRMLGAYGFLRALFEVFDRHRTAVDVVTTSEVSVSLTVEDTGSLEAILADLRGLGSVSLERDRAIVCVVGEGLRATPGIAARVFATVRDINVALISQGASRVNLTFVVEEARVGEVVCRLHQAFFEPARGVA